MIVVVHSFFPFLKESVFVTIPPQYTGYGKKVGVVGEEVK